MHTDACTMCALSPKFWGPRCGNRTLVEALANTQSERRNDWVAPPSRLHSDHERHCLISKWALRDPTGWRVLSTSNRSGPRRMLLRARPDLHGRRVLLLEDPRYTGGLTVKRNHRALRTTAAESGLRLDIVRVRQNDSAIGLARSNVVNIPLVGLYRTEAAAVVIAHLQHEMHITSDVTYDGVVTWFDQLVPLADDVAEWLGIPPARRYLGPGAPSPESKLAAREILMRGSGSTTAPALAFAQVRSTEAAIAAARNVVGFPCFLKPATGAGGSSGMHGKLLSGRLDNEQQLSRAAWEYELIGSQVFRSEAILERFLEGPEVYAELVVQNGEILAASLRAKNRPQHSKASLRPYEWVWPAMLPPKDHTRCVNVVTDAVRMLDLRNGIYGMQLIIDQTLGCAFLELNMRPTNWPTLHDASFQLLFQPDLWLYAVCALVLAVGDDPSPYMLLDTEPPLQVAANCSGAWLEQLNYFSEELALYGSRHMGEHGCVVRIRPFGKATFRTRRAGHRPHRRHRPRHADYGLVGATRWVTAAMRGALRMMRDRAIQIGLGPASSGQLSSAGVGVANPSNI